MNIIILTSAGMATGGVRQSLYLAAGLRDMGHSVDFICRPDSETKKLALGMGMRCTDLPKKIRDVNRTLRGLMPKGEPVVVHAFHNRGVKLAAYLGTLWRFQGLPVVCVAHRGVTSRPGNPLPYLLPGIRSYMVNSKICASLMPLLWRRKRCHLVSNSVPEERLVPVNTVQEIRQELEIPEDHLVVGNVAYNKPEKGVAELIKAFAASRAHIPPSTLVVVGVTPELFMPLCNELGVTEYVRLVKRTEHVANYVQIMALMSFTSRFIESQPNVIMEAMSMGIPVIGGNIGGIPDMLPPDCLFDPKDVSSISAKIIEKMNNPERLREMAQENLQKKYLFSMDHRLKIVLEQYAAVLKERHLDVTPPTARGAGAKPRQ